MPSIYVPAELPETCYPIDAAYWIALGRPPVFRRGHHGTDKRNTEEFFGGYGGGCPFQYLEAFSQAEFALAAIDVDFDRYEFVYRNAGHSPASDFQELYDVIERAVEHATDVSEKARERGRQKLEKLKDLTGQAMAEASWVKNLISRFDAILDPAKIMIFQALKSGALAATAMIKHEVRLGTTGTEHIREWAPVPSESWTLRYDWDWSMLPSDATALRAIHVRTAEMLALFSSPLAASTLRHASVFPSAVVLAQDEPPTAGDAPVMRRGRGRPYKGEGIVKEVVQAVLGDQFRRAGKNDGIKESLYAEACALASKLNVPITRGTAQNYLNEFAASRQ